MDDETEQAIFHEMQHNAQRKAMPAGYSPLPKIPTGRYTRRDMFELELEHVFGKSWVCAGREDELKEHGSFTVFDKLGPTILVARGKDDTLRAFYNSCQHRGARVVKENCGRTSLFRCQYHAWTYDLEGKLVAVPDDERDFGKIDKSKYGLKSVACQAWNGWIFINLDPQAPSLQSDLAPVIQELNAINMADLRTVLKWSRIVPCNWKLASEAFQEAYHTPTVHKQLGPGINAHSHSVGLFENGHSRMFTGFKGSTGRAIALQNDDDPKIAGLPALFRQESGSYLMFPNLVTAMRPSGIIFIMFWPRGLRETEIQAIGLGPNWGDGERPVYWDNYTKAYDQLLAEDCENLEQMQNSMESGALDGLTLGFPERRIYWTNQEIDRRIGRDLIPHDLVLDPVLSNRSPELSVAAE